MIEPGDALVDRVNAAWDALVAGAPEPESALDPTLAATLRTLHALDDAPAPEAAFADRLWQQIGPLAGQGAVADGLSGGAARRWHRLPLASPSRWWPLAGLATAAVLVVGLLGLALSLGRPQPVSAQEVLERARATANDAAAGGVRSFELVEAVVTRGAWRPASPEGERRTVRSVWFAAPDRWRFEVTAPPGPGQGSQPVSEVTVADGETIWSYDSVLHHLQINPGTLGGRGQGKLWLSGGLETGAADNLDALLAQGRTCYDPAVGGDDTVAGRPAYVVQMGPNRCPSVSAREMNGPRTIWIDRETFFVLRNEVRDPESNQVIFRSEVTSIRYNVELPDELFALDPPPGARVTDNRPRPAPTADEFRKQIEQLARQVDFPLFVPRRVPSGLVPVQPRLDDLDGQQVQLGYVPPDEAGKTALAGLTGMRITEQKASYELVSRWTAQAEPMEIAGGKGWLRRGVRNPDGTGSDSAAIVLRDGTIVSVASFTVAVDELLGIAAALEPVPGSHPPLPAPTAPTIAEVRQRVTFPVFVPTWVPAGLTPEPPVGGEQPQAGVRLNYHAADGSVALTVLNGPAGCCLDADPRKTGLSVTLPNGTVAHFLDVQPQYGGPILWWQQQGAYVALSGPHLTKDDLVQIAASTSPTADLGPTEAPPARPTATPVPAPSFAILRPTWLPEPMTVREQYVPNPNGPGSGVTLSFDPRPDDKPHDLLTLSELPKGGEPLARVQDPQATTEQIGGREVVIVRRGQGCVTASWVQGEVALTLTNPYDPPGPPGQVRYSCDQLRRIIESVR